MTKEEWSIKKSPKLPFFCILGQEHSPRLPEAQHNQLHIDQLNINRCLTKWQPPTVHHTKTEISPDAAYVNEHVCASMQHW